MEEPNELIKSNEIELIGSADVLYGKLNAYLLMLDLPVKGLVAPIKERTKVVNNLPDILSDMQKPDRNESTYISKFIIACCSGLFDAALNFLWDETIVRLRKKVENFDLEFFKSIIKDSNKVKNIATADDLSKIDDAELIEGCSEIGIISEIGYKHLDYIRSMRNWISAAHPNHAELTGLNLCDWFEICIKEVINKEPSEPALNVRSLIKNIKSNTYTEQDVQPIKKALSAMPKENLSSLFKSLFGIFCDVNTSVNVKQNIRLIANDIWSNVTENIKNEAGLKYGEYALNGDKERKQNAKDFLELVDGLSYLNDDTKTAEMSYYIDSLYNAHFGFDNFSNEYSFSKSIERYIPDTGKIPNAIRQKYVKVILLCRMGNYFGVSYISKPIYNRLIDKFTDCEISTMFSLLSDSDIKMQLQYPNCRKEMKEIISMLKDRTGNNVLLQLFEIIEKEYKNIENITAIPLFVNLLNQIH